MSHNSPLGPLGAGLASPFQGPGDEVVVAHHVLEFVVGDSEAGNRVVGFL